MRIVYMAHPLGVEPQRSENLDRALQWYLWILNHRRDVAVVADWIIVASMVGEEHRARGLAMDLALVERCDEIWLVGGRISPGMQTELDHAIEHGKIVVDLTHLGTLPPKVEAA